ncbi:MAG: diacylglycerol kinase family protein [Clostridia bacterium]|nr:diacylglycerol kinase family protein [Clostridia bacterium]
MNPKQECKKLINSFKYAIEGFISSFKTERNMKIHILAMILVIALGVYLKLKLIEWCIIASAISLVIGGELFNTAIETIVDMVSPEKNPKAKLAKDISAAAVLAVSIGAAIVGGLIFIPKI